MMSTFAGGVLTIDNYNCKCIRTFLTQIHAVHIYCIVNRRSNFKGKGCKYILAEVFRAS